MEMRPIERGVVKPSSRPKLGFLSTEVLAVVCAISATAVWGATDVLTKLLVMKGAPLLVVAVQLSFSGLLCLSLIVVRFEYFEINLNTVSGWLLGALHPGISSFLGINGLYQLQASIVSSVWSIEGVMTLGLAWIVSGQKIGPTQFLLSILAFTGVLLALHVEMSLVEGGVNAFAFTVLLSAVLSCALYSTLLKLVDIPRKNAGLVLLGGQQLIGLFVFTSLWALSSQRAQLFQLSDLSSQQLILCLLAGALKFLIATGLFVFSLRHLSTGRASSFLVLTPAFSIALAFAVLRERMDWQQWLGIAAIMSSVIAMEIRVASTSATD